MRFTENELKIIYQYSLENREETLNRLEKIVIAVKEETTKNLIKNTIEKLQKIAEPECGNFIKNVKKYFLNKKHNSIHQKLAEARIKSSSAILLGHDLMGEERFMKEAHHMIMLEILNDNSPVGYKGECYRFFLSDEGYKNAKLSEQRGEIKIKSHFSVFCGKLYSDKKPPDRNR